MVLVQSGSSASASHRFAPRIHPNPARVLGVAGAIALPAALLVALSIPMSGFDLALPQPLERVPIQWIVPEEKKPDPPIVVPVIRPQPATPQPVVEQRVAPPVADPPIVVEQGSALDQPYVPTVDAVDTAPQTLPDPGPVPGVRLEYASAPPPAYPPRLVRDRVEGQVMLQVLVDVDGSPLEVSVQRSSGNRELDRAAQQHVLKKWRFRPATRNGQPVQAIGLVPIDFKLQ